MSARVALRHQLIIKTKKWNLQFKNAIAEMQQLKLQLFVHVMIAAPEVHALVVALAALNNQGGALSSP